MAGNSVILQDIFPSPSSSNPSILSLSLCHGATNLDDTSIGITRDLKCPPRLLKPECENEMDPGELEDLKQDFLASLRDDLTFNSRPVIMNLTQIAGENINAASTIAKALEEHIQKAPPSLKLPALYLLDSICKNIGSPYPLLFGRNIYRTFMDAYTLVDPPVRRKLEELLSTWKDPPPTGMTNAPVFPVDVTRKIENALLKAKTLALQLEQRRQREIAASGLGPHRSTPPINYPHQTGWNGNMNMVNVFPPPPTQMAPSNQDILLAEIRNLLTTVTHSLLLNPTDEAARTQSAALNQLQTILQTSMLPYEQVESVRQQLATLPIAQNRQRQTATPPISEPPPQEQNAESLLRSLRDAGLLSAPVSVPSPVPNVPPIQPLAINSNVANLRNSDLELTSASLQKPRPYLIDLLYNPQDLQCRTCARRFPNTDDGPAKRDAHLDWHFRVNKRLRENIGRGQTRSWYLTEEEWIKNREEDTSVIHTAQASQVKESTPQPDATIQAPTGALADQPCPICKEKFNSEWDEEKEDWVWRNAIRVGGKIYHASCFAETRGKASGTMVGSNSASRGGTPQPGEPLGSILGKRKGAGSNPEATKIPRLTE